jgi:hypothetical protein
MPTAVQPFPFRSAISDDGMELRISIPPKRSWTLLFLIAWLTLWTYGGLHAAHELLARFSLFLILWMIGWAVGEVFASFTILYAIAGRELISVTPTTLTLKVSIFGIGFTRAYAVAAMRDLRFQPDTSVGRNRRTSRIAFDYGAKTVTFAQEIGEPEAAEIIARINQRCNIAQTPTPSESGIKFWQHD